MTILVNCVFQHFGPWVYLMGSLVIALVCPCMCPCVSVLVYISRTAHQFFPETLYEVGGQYSKISDTAGILKNLNPGIK